METARPNQISPPGDWDVWACVAGRGFGKTRCGGEDAVDYALWNPGVRVAVVAPTHGDLRRTCFEGDSGLLGLIPPECLRGGSRDTAYNRTLFELWLDNGSKFEGYSSVEPERLRGPQFHRAWCDELAAWRYPLDTWDMLQMGLRLGDSPRAVITTTPRPIKLLKDILASVGTIISGGSTFENEANLAANFLKRLREKYAGTRLGRQELYAELLMEAVGALWTHMLIEKKRVRVLPAMSRIVVAVDPATTAKEGSNETGIVVAGKGYDGDFYVIEDATIAQASPDKWASRACAAWRMYKADRIVAEKNQGGDMVESTIRTVNANVPYRGVHATRGKYVRAEPIAALYEQGRVHHVGLFPALEDQMCSMTPDFDREQSGYSPDRVDALVWALTELSEGMHVPIVMPGSVSRGSVETSSLPALAGFSVR